MSYDQAKDCQEKIREIIHTLAKDSSANDYFLGALSVALGSILKDHHLSQGCWMDVLKEKLEEAVQGAVDTANDCVEDFHKRMKEYEKEKNNGKL